MKWHIPHRLPKYGQSKKWRQNDSLGQEYWSHCQLFPTKVFRVFSKSRQNISCDKQRVGKPGGISAALPLAFCLSSTNLVKYWWRADLAAKRRDQVSNKYLQKKPPMGEKAWGRKSSPWKKATCGRFYRCKLWGDLLFCFSRISSPRQNHFDLQCVRTPTTIW